MAAWDDQPLGAFGTASQVPTNAWFPVNTDTGQWGTQAPTLASDAGVNWAGIPDLIPTRTMAPSPMMGGFGGVGGPDQAPLAIGQVAGTMAPSMTTPRSMQRVQRLDEMGALTRQPGMWETIARSVGTLSPQGRQILQSSDQQQQQQLQNRLTMRRQALQEEQNERAEIRDDFTTFMKLSEIKSKALRNLYTDRFVADMQARGKSLPADFVEAFKKTGIDEGQQMAKLLEPLLTESGLDPAVATQLLAEGRSPKDIMDAMELAQKQKKFRLEQEESAGLTTGLATLGGASGVTPPPTTGAPGGVPGTSTTPTPPTARQPLAAPSKDISDAIDESTRLYPQVRKDLITSIAASESNFDPQATSPKGAQGLMQLMPAAQKEMGVTDPFDAKQNVRGGTGYYAKMLERYKGNEAIALAAYNWGPGHVDSVGGDLSKMPESVQTYVKTTLQRASSGGTAPTQQPDTRMQVAGPGAPAPTQPTAPGGTSQEQTQLGDLNARITAMDQFITANAGKGSDRAKATVAAIERQRDNLAKERDRLQDRLGEVPRALEKETAMQPLKIAQQEAGARVQIEAKMNEPIGTENAIKMDLPADTKWKDVPKGTRVLDRTPEGAMTKLGDYKASHEGITRVIGMLDQPGAKSIVGTLLSSDDNAAFRRAAGAWISSVTPAERKFAASLVAEIAGIRNAISGQNVTAQEAEFLTPLLPSVADPDIATVRAKLEVLQEWIARKHEGVRTQLDEAKFRTPKALDRPAAPAPKDPKDKLLEKYTR